MKIYDAADFWARVKDVAAKRKGYTQQQIADLSGCSLMFVSNLRARERKRPSWARRSLSFQDHWRRHSRRREGWCEMRLGIGVEFDGAHRAVGTIATKPGIGAVFPTTKNGSKALLAGPFPYRFPLARRSTLIGAIRPLFRRAFARGVFSERYCP